MDIAITAELVLGDNEVVWYPTSILVVIIEVNMGG